jgi:ADP-heptose:LPS heptosyltransferase
VKSRQSGDHKKLYRQRRRYRDNIVGLSWYRRIGKKIEEFNKRLTVGLVGKLLGVYRVDPPLDPESIESVLIIRHDAIGDMIITTPIWKTLKQRYPDIRIGVIASFRNRPVLEADPDIDHVYECAGESFRDIWRVSRQTRRQKWSVVMPMLYHRKTKMAVACRLFAPGAISSMILLPNTSIQRYQHLFHVVIPSEFGPDRVHMTARIKNHLEATFGIDIPVEQWRLSIHFDPAKQTGVRSAMSALIHEDGTSGYIHINLEAKNAFREYGLENNFALSRELRRRFPNLSIFWTASPIAMESARQYLSQHSSDRIHLLETESLPELGAVVEGADLVISPDTSVIHMASAFRRPVLGLYYVRNEWGPWQTKNRMLFPNLGEPAASIPVDAAVAAASDLLQSA